MLAKFYYYLVTAVEALFSVFGIRSFHEQPRYVVTERLGDEVEIRSYEPRQAVETTVQSTDFHAAESEAFRLLLAYIAGAADRSRGFVDTWISQMRDRKLSLGGRAADDALMQAAARRCNLAYRYECHAAACRHGGIVADG
jgi:hypothetical protein